MRSRRFIRWMVALAALSTLSLGLFLGVGPYASAKSPTKAHKPPSHGGKPPSSSSAIGCPAIPVKRGVPLTANDVRAYVTKHPLGKPQTIVFIQETTYGQIGYLSSRCFYVPPAQEPVFYVRLRGPFVSSFSPPPSAAAAPPPVITQTVNDMEEVFDANTGDFIGSRAAPCGETSSGGGTPISIPLIGTPTVPPPRATPLPC